MTDEQLREIEERARQFTNHHSLEYWAKVAGDDFPALIAEIRRLRSTIDAMLEWDDAHSSAEPPDSINTDSE